MWKVRGRGREESARVGKEKEAEEREGPGEGGHLWKIGGWEEYVEAQKLCLTQR